MPVEIWLGGLLVIMIVTALICLEMKNILSSLVTLGVIGLLLSLSFLILQAPDLALAQFIYEILVISISIIIMTATKLKEERSELSDSISGRVAAIFVLLPILLIGYLALKELPVFGEPLLKVSQRYLTLGAKETGIVNLVTAVTLDYRVYDTLGEAIIIFAGVLGGITIIKGVGKNDRGE